jgi:hypothetical protein
MAAPSRAAALMKSRSEEYADRFHPPILHDQGADAMLGQLADRNFDAVRGVYPLNAMALGP